MTPAEAAGAPAVPLVDQYEAVRSGTAVHVTERDVVSVSGPDAADYLQGQCSQDLAGLEPGAAADALLLSPQGKIDAVIRVSRQEGEGFVLDTDPGFGPAVVARLERFRLRTRVEVAPLAGWTCVAVRGPGAASCVVGSPTFVLPVAWPGVVGLDLLGPAPSALSDWVADRAVPCGDDAWDAVRIEAGIPVAGRDDLEGAIPAETGLIDRTVSLTKGCYTGQELVARLDARGSKVARRLCGVVVHPDLGEVAGGAGAGSAPPVGTVVLTADGGHEVGRLTSVAWSPGIGATVALSMVHRRVDLPGSVLLRADGPTVPGGSPGAALLQPAEARSLPLRT